MKDDHEKFNQLGGKIVAVARHDEKKVQNYWKENQLPYMGIPDPDAGLGNLYHQQSKILKLGLMPAMFVIDKQGKIAFSHYSSSMSDIPTNDSVLKVLAGLSE